MCSLDRIQHSDGQAMRFYCLLVKILPVVSRCTLNFAFIGMFTSNQVRVKYLISYKIQLSLDEAFTFCFIVHKYTEFHTPTNALL